MWMDYLRWYRRVLRLPIENGIEVSRIRPCDSLLALELSGGAETRKVVMATGREGLGRPSIGGLGGWTAGKDSPQRRREGEDGALGSGQRPAQGHASCRARRYLALLCASVPLW